MLKRLLYRLYERQLLQPVQEPFQHASAHCRAGFRMLKRLLYRLYERQLLTDVLGGQLPRHIGLIQDGHRRYSRDVGLENLSQGYRIGAEKTEEVLMWCADLDIPTVTLWALSTDNLARPVADVADILQVIEEKVAQWVQG